MSPSTVSPPPFPLSYTAALPLSPILSLRPSREPRTTRGGAASSSSNSSRHCWLSKWRWSSWVLKEAGFSSTSVKINIENDDSSSVFHCYAGDPSGVGGVFSSPSSPTRGTFWQTWACFPEVDDMKLILEVLLRKKSRNVVVLGDSLSTSDGLVVELIGRVERGEVPDDLKSAQFIKFQFAPLSFSYMELSDVDSNVTELKRKIDSIPKKGNGAIVYA